MSSSVKLTLPLFEGKAESYQAWKTTCELTFRGAGFRKHLTNHTLEQFTDQTSVVGEKVVVIKTKKQLFDEYTEACDATSGNLLSRLDTISLQLVKDLVHPADIFKKLDETYNKRTLLTQINIITSLMNSPQAEADDPAVHCDTWFKLIQNANQNGVNKKELSVDSLLSMLFIKSIHPRYEVCIHGFQTASTAPSMETMKAELIATSERWKLNPPENIVLSNVGSVDARSRVNEHCKKCKTEHWKNSKCPIYCTNCSRMHFGVCRFKKQTAAVVTEDANSVDILNVDKINKVSTLWYLDSGATTHLCVNESTLHDIKPSNVVLTSANNSRTMVKGIGSIHLQLDTNIRVTLKNVMLLPTGNKNLISLSVLTDQGNDIMFSSKSAEIYSRDTGKLMATCTRVGNLYKLDAKVIPPRAEANSLNTLNEAKIWHERMGHIGIPATKMLIKCNIFKPEYEHHEFCEACAIGKSKRLPFTASKTKYTTPGQVVNADIKFFPVPTISGEIGAATYLDRATDFSFVYLITQKSSSIILKTFNDFEALFFNTFGYHIKVLRTDNGSEYVNKAFKERLTSLGIDFQTTCRYSPQQNGAAERLNRTLDEKLMTMKTAGEIPNKLWGELFKTANFLRNRTPSAKLNGKTPFEKWYGLPPPMDHFRVIGCDVYVHVPTELRKALDPKAIKCKMLGYATSQKAYRLWDIEKQEIVISRDCTFHEDTKSLPYNFKHGNKLNKNEIAYTMDDMESSYNDTVYAQVFPKTINAAQDQVAPTPEITYQPIHPQQEDESSDASQSTTSSEADNPAHDTDYYSNDFDSSDTDTVHVPVEAVIPCNAPIVEAQQNNTNVQPRRSSRLNHTNAQDQFILSSIFGEDPFDSVLSSEMSTESTRFIPKNHKEAMASEDADKWMLAAMEEMTSLQINNVYSLVKRPTNKKTIKTRYVYSIKELANGDIDKYKVRYVVKGFNQIHGIDYMETFSPVIKSKSVKILLSMANAEGWQVHQMDVKTAFLNAELTELLYVEQPDGFVNKQYPGYVWKLNKALYGLKQSPREWWLTMRDLLYSLGFEACNLDPCIFVLVKDGVKSYIGLYVDDLQITGNYLKQINEIKGQFNTRFQMKDLGLVSYMLGLEIKMNTKLKHLTICQEKYVNDLLVQFELDTLRPVSIPMDPSTKLSIQSCPELGSPEYKEMQHKPYRELVGALMYLACATRPDISHAVGEVARFVCNPGMNHWKAVVYICRYLVGTANYGLHFDGNVKDGGQVHGYSDADWGGDVDTRRSKTGYAIFMNGGCASWRSKLQKCISQSTLEAELVAANETGRELVWARGVATELGYQQRTSTLFEDNQPCIATSKNPIINDRVKHIDIKYHWIREEVAAGSFTLIYCPTADMTADILTKALPRITFSRLRDKLGLRSVRSLSGRLLDFKLSPI